MKYVALLLLITAVTLSSAKSVAQTKRPLSNQDIVDLTKAGLGDDAIITDIGASETNFDTTPQSLIGLKNEGVSPNVLKAMISKGRPTESTSDSGDLPNDVGIYLMKSGKINDLGAEVVNFRSGGYAKKLLTDGFDKGYVNGLVNAPHSSTQLSLPGELIMVTYEGITPSEFVLVKLDEKSDHREFRQESENVLHTTTGPGKNTQQFQFERLASRTYRIKIGKLAKGEYGFLPPVGVDNKNAQATGRIYTFSVAD